MLNRLKLFFYILIAIAWFGIVLPYFLLQTNWGAKYTSKLLMYWIPNYDISIGKISHSMAKPYELTFENIHIQDKAQSKNNLTANKLIVGLKSNHLLQYQSFAYVYVFDGEINVASNTQGISTDFLQLNHVSINYENAPINHKINLVNLSGGIKPWNSQVLTRQTDSEFSFTVDKAQFDDLSIDSILIEGNQKNRQLNITNFGADLSQAAINGNVSVFPDNSLYVNRLKINKLNYQSKLDIAHINKMFMDWPKITIRKLSILNSSINLPNFIIENGNLEVSNLNYQQGWQLEKSNLMFNAENVIWFDESINNPLLQWHLDNDQLIIEHGIANWNKGNINFSGNLQNKSLNIDSLIASGIYYQLPNNWYQSLNNLDITNDLFTQIKIKQFILMPSFIISTNPTLPFQLDAFETFGKNVQLQSKANALKLSGIISIKAEHGILNKINLEKPDLIINFKPKCSEITFSSLVEKGFLEGEACLTNPKDVQSLTLQAHTVNSQILSLWHIINNPLNTNKFTVELNGTLDPLNLSGKLQTNNNFYSIDNNRLISY